MILVFLGPPGSGKGTQAKLLAEELKIPQIALGDMLREEVRAGTEIGKQVKKLIDAGKLAPDELTIELARKRIKQEDCQSGFIFDGFPRSAAQAEALDQMLAEGNLTLNRVIYFRIREEQVVERLLRRAGLEGRADDNEDAIRTRFEVYEKETQPLIERYAECGKLVEINAAGTIEEVFRDLKAVALAP